MDFPKYNKNDNEKNAHFDTRMECMEFDNPTTTDYFWFFI